MEYKSDICRNRHHKVAPGCQDSRVELYKSLPLTEFLIKSPRANKAMEGLETHRSYQVQVGIPGFCIPSFSYQTKDPLQQKSHSYEWLGLLLAFCGFPKPSRHLYRSTKKIQS